MKVILVNARHYYGGGDSTYTFNLADLLHKNGHEVFYFAMQDDRNLPDPNSDLFVNNIDFRELNRHKNPITGLKVLTSSIYSRVNRIKFAQLLDRVHPDLVHLQNIHAHITPSIIFEAKKRGIPVVWTLHDYKLICPNSHFLVDNTGQICEACKGGQFWHAATRQCKKGSFLASTMASIEAYSHQIMKIRNMIDAFLCPSKFLYNKLIDNDFQVFKLHNIPLFLPVESFYQPLEDDGYLLFFGKLDPIKGIFPLIEAARRTPSVNIILAGRGEDSFLSQLPINVKFVGFKSGNELKMLLTKARATLVPSLWYENQPFSILESFAAGKPVIASDLGGMTELIGKNERGYLFEPGNIQELANTMEWVSSNPDEVRNTGKVAQEYARKYHSEEAHYLSIINLYKLFLN
jgi:glycosyltransferase involved in cell wall biosynthesis